MQSGHARAGCIWVPNVIVRFWACRGLARAAALGQEARVVTTTGEAEVAQVGEPLGGSASIGADEGEQAGKAQVGMGLKKRRTRKHKWTRIGAHRQSAKGRM